MRGSPIVAATSSELGASVGVPNAVAERDEQLHRRVVVLVLYLADDLLDEILDRDDSVGAGKFVDHDREVRSLRPHVRQHVERPTRLGHVKRLAHQLSPVGRRLGAPCEVGEHVLDVDHADHLVERFAVDRNARVAVFGKDFDQLVPARARRDGDDLTARDGDVVGIVFAEMQQVAEHGQLDRGEVALRRARLGLVLVLVDRFLDLRAE